MGDEADALTELGDELEAYEDDFERECEEMFQRYLDAENTSVHGKMSCPTCGRPIVKTSYQHKFCSNKRSGNCKDRFHNCMNESRRNRIW